MVDNLTAELIQATLNTSYVGRRLVLVQEATSTMEIAASEAAGGAPEGTLIVAEEQTAGRGRFGRAWVSPRGAAIYISILRRPPPKRMPGLNMALSLAIVRAAYDVAAVSADIKWANDVEVNGRKLAGILVDAAVGQAGDVMEVIVGVGMNVNLDSSAYPEIAKTATSLKKEIGRHVSRLAVLTSLLQHFEKLYDRLKSGESLFGEWRQCVNVVGKTVKVTFPAIPGADSLVGLVESVDKDGALLLRKEDGVIERLVAGEVSLRQENG